MIKRTTAAIAAALAVLATLGVALATVPSSPDDGPVVGRRW